jgi:Bacteriophage translational regulator
MWSDFTMSEDIFRGTGVEISLPDRQAFLKIEETLTRIGVASRKEKHLFQSCHILHKRQRYAIVHFKEMFLLDGKPTTISEEDLGRRNKIATLLQDWKLCTIISKDPLSPLSPMSHIKVISWSEKPEWKLFPKYAIGAKKKPLDNSEEVM